MLALEIRHSGGKSRRQRLPERDLIIGRDFSNDVVLSQASASRFHAAIVLRNSGEYVLRDLGSRNGTAVNGRKVFRHILQPNDEIRIGSETVIFLGPSSQVAPSGVKQFIAMPQRRGAGRKLPATTSDLGELRHLKASATIAGFKGSRHDDNELIEILKCAQVVASTNSTSIALTRLLDSIIAPLRGKRSFALLRDGERLFCEAVRPEGVVRPGELKCIPAVYEALEDRVAVLWKGHEPDGLDTICIPLLAGGVAFGVVGIEGAFRQQQSIQGLNLANALCGLCATHVDNARERERLQQQCMQLQESVQASHRFVGSSPVLQKVYGGINQAAQSDFPLLITGETGTGKELVAKAVHNLSRRSGKPFVVCNCVTMPETLIEAELFGYAPLSGIANANPKGKTGKFEAANGGTIFLDEVGDLPSGTQVKLLRILEDYIVEPIGAEKSVQVDVRVIAATNRDLGAMVADHAFREDLYHRLNFVQIAVPPLRERSGDILLLTAYVIEQVLPAPLNEKVEITKEVARILMSERLTGNFRELRNMIIKAAQATTSGRLEAQHLSPGESAAPVFKNLQQIEKEHIEMALRVAAGNKRKAAHLLGICHQTLYTKIAEYGILFEEGATEY